MLADREKIKEEGFVLCLDTGSVLRSHAAKEMLRYMGVWSIAAGLGDVSNQYFQGYQPYAVLKAIRESMPGAMPGPIQEVNEKLASSAKCILILDSKYLYRHPYIDPNDPRVFIKEVKDVSNFKDADTYSSAIKEAMYSTYKFANENLPEKYYDIRNWSHNKMKFLYFPDSV